MYLDIKTLTLTLLSLYKKFFFLRNMKIFAGLVLAASAAEISLGAIVTTWCGTDLNDFYTTEGLALEYR